MICAIVLAAGESRRMGAHKLLLPYAGKTVISHIVDQLLDSAIGGIYVIVGHEGARIAEELSVRPVRVVSNPDYRTGMLSSVRCGLRALPPRCEAILVALGDQPGISPELVGQMIHSFNRVDKGIVVPCFRGKRGHPIVFSERFRNEIMTQYDRVGLRGLLQAHPEDVFELNVLAPAVLSDMDYPEDYRRELALLENSNRAKHKHASRDE